MALGSAFGPLPRPPEPDEPDRLEQMLMRLAAAVDGMTAVVADLAEREPPAPPPMPAVDLSEIVTAVTDLKPGATAEEIAEAVADQMRPPAPPGGDGATNETLGKVAKALENLDFRLKGMGTQAYGGGAVELSQKSIDKLTDGIQVSVEGGDASADLQRDIKRAVTDYETRLDYDVRTDANPVYVGKALEGTATSATGWVIQKLGYDASNRLTRAQVLTGIWDDRASLAW